MKINVRVKYIKRKWNNMIFILDSLDIHPHTIRVQVRVTIMREYISTIMQNSQLIED